MLKVSPGLVEIVLMITVEYTKKPKSSHAPGLLLFAYCLSNGFCYFVRTQLQVALTVRIVIKEEQLNQDRLGGRVFHHV